MPTDLFVNHGWWNKRGDARAACLDLDARVRKLEAAAAKAAPSAPVETSRREEYVTLRVCHSSTVPARNWNWQVGLDQGETVTVVQPIALVDRLAVYTDKCERLEADNVKTARENKALRDNLGACELIRDELDRRVIRVSRELTEANAACEKKDSQIKDWQRVDNVTTASLWVLRTALMEIKKTIEDRPGFADPKIYDCVLKALDLASNNEAVRDKLKQMDHGAPKPMIYMPRFDSYAGVADYITAVCRAVDDAGVDFTYEKKPGSETNA